MTNAKLSRLIREAIEEEGPRQQAFAFHKITQAAISVYMGLTTPEGAMVRFFDSPVWPNTGLPVFEQDQMLEALMLINNMRQP